MNAHDTDGRYQARHLQPRSRAEQDDQPFSGKPLRNAATEADPQAVCAPGIDPYALTGCGRVFAMGNGDLRSPVDRLGSTQADTFPSRRGNRLFYPDGRITDLNGNSVFAPEVMRSSLPDCVGAPERIRRVMELRYSPRDRRD